MELIIYFQEMWQLAVKGQAQGVFFWFAFYMFIVCFYSLTLQFRMRYWPFVQGELVEFGLDKFGASIVKSDQNYWANALYNYSVSGVNYSGTRISPWLMLVSHNLRFILENQISYVQRSSDGTVKVFYSPNNPKKSFLIIAGKTGIGITLLISVLPLILFYYKYHV
ncbi:MAG: DUF3592 domain-containing protein [Colwellia sp.]|nr:DUF3592 domain-containing protein [Colwellia sp.]